MINLFLSLRVESISLGQGQGPIAEKIIHAAMKTGKWVFLQNCHLAVSWMLAMEELIKTFTEPGITHIDMTLKQSPIAYKHISSLTPNSDVAAVQCVIILCTVALHHGWFMG